MLVFDALTCLVSSLWFWDVIRREVCRVGFDQRNPKPETRNRLLKLVSNCETRNPKPETDSEDLTSPGPIETRNPKPETRNRLWRLTFPRTDRNPKPETRNPADSEDLTSPGPIETRNPKPETDSESGFQSTKPETRNPKPTAKVGFKRRNPKPETDSESWFQSTKPETRNRLESDFWVALRIGTPGFPVASPCLWGKLQNLSFSNVSKCENWRTSRTKSSFWCSHLSRLESPVSWWLRRVYGGSRKTFPFRRFPSRLSCRFAWQAWHFVTFQPVW